MPYIGRGTDKLSNVEVLDNITFDGSSSYTLQKGGSNFTPSSANTILLSIDGVVQAGNFTVSGSTIDFGTAVAGTSTCDFILHYGTGLITTPADGTVTTAKLADSSVSLAKLTATGTKDSTTFLRGDNTFAVPAGGTNTPAFHARTSTSQSLTRFSDTKITNFVTDFDTATGFSSNTYTVPTGEGGKYCIYFSLSINSGVAGGDGEAVRGRIFKNGSYLSGFQSILQDNGAFNMYIANYSANFIGVATLSAGDTLDLYGYTADQNNTGQIESNSHTIFGAYKLVE